MADKADAADITELVDEGPCPAEGVDPQVDGAAEEHGDEIGVSEVVLTQPHRLGPPLVVVLLFIVALGGLVGWLGFRAAQSHEREHYRAMFLAAARQGALNLTSISYADVDADIKRILDSATGTFHDDFQKRSEPFVAVVKQAQSKSQGTVTEAGLESMDGDNARALVAVTVTTSSAGTPQQGPRSWRMRIDVQKVGDSAKVSNVEFIP